MTIVDALYGRGRMRRAALSRVWLLALLILVPIGLRALEVDVFFFVRVATVGEYARAGAHWIYMFRDVIACASYVVAGIAYDQLGLKRGFALAILAWCAIVPLATVVDPIAYRVLSSPLTAMVPGFAITGFLLAARLAWPLRRRGVVTVVLLVIYERAYERGLLHLRFSHGYRDVPETWQFPILVLTTFGAVLFVIWLLGLRERDAGVGLDLRPQPSQHDAWAGILSSKAVWTILAIEVCQTVMWHFSKGLRWEQQNLRDATAATNIILAWATPAAALAAAWVSDRIYRQRRSWIAARRPFLLIGFALAGAAPLLGALATQSGPLLHIIDLVAFGAFYVTSLVFLDCVPRRSAGRVIGFVLAGESVASFYGVPLLDGLARGLHSVVPLIVLFALIGAAVAARLLPRLQPVEP